MGLIVTQFPFGYIGQWTGAVTIDLPYVSLDHLRHHGVRHHAVMRTVPTTTGGQTRLIAGLEDRYDRP